jgi:TfoX/Sxy family transcriptional regulator of competence genes
VRSNELPLLRRTIDLLLMDWPHVIPKKMFGTDAYFVNGNIFALIDTGKFQAGVKLIEKDMFDKAMALKGSSPFAPGDEPMRHWVVLPDAICRDEEKLEKYLSLSYKSIALLKPKILKTRGRDWLT